ncbi:unnamed protein product [Ceutorhynchus assimilis]|uniref:Uncharacterized protein n=1 Tax=Ceutorhynchus assimilis TaxID=467358 RepID=A0A9N9MU03_9CUCU|nr:unnamed protein product [Ceutorhynchus assimilis]
MGYNSYWKYSYSYFRVFEHNEYSWAIKQPLLQKFYIGMAGFFDYCNRRGHSRRKRNDH